jgi:hypothetical protein
LEGLPAAPSDGHHCFDRNKDGKVDQQTECIASHEWIIPLPSEAARRPEIPFKWVGLNWNPHGHIPRGCMTYRTSTSTFRSQTGQVWS